MVHKKRGLRMMIVSMLSSSPKNGVELMDEIESMTHGWWRPSPGSVYPVLEQLTSDGMIRKKDDGRYELSDKAHDELEWSFGPSFRKPRSMDDMINEVSGFVSYFEELNKADRTKAAPYIDKIKEIADRLATIAKQKKED
jgi:DNA-binding PadR family transcriptional regulator